MARKNGDAAPAEKAVVADASRLFPHKMYAERSREEVPMGRGLRSVSSPSSQNLPWSRARARVARYASVSGVLALVLGVLPLGCSSSGGAGPTGGAGGA